jgi:phage terminase Nu1 subunit (DNA packaging protein)
VRNAVLAVPSRLRSRLPHLTPEDVQTIDAELRNTPTALAEDRAEPARLQQLAERPGG